MAQDIARQLAPGAAVTAMHSAITDDMVHYYSVYRRGLGRIMVSRGEISRGLMVWVSRLWRRIAILSSTPPTACAS